MRFENFKCVKMDLRLGLGPRPHWENLQRSPRPLTCPNVRCPVCWGHSSECFCAKSLFINQVK